jgi:hypothetical protein
MFTAEVAQAVSLRSVRSGETQMALVLPSPLPKIAGNAARRAMSRENVNISQQCTTFSRFFSRGSDSVWGSVTEDRKS